MLLHVQALKAEHQRVKEALPYIACSVKDILRATTDILSDPTSSDAAAAKESISELAETLQDQLDSFAEDVDWSVYKPASAVPQQSKRQVSALTGEAAVDVRQQLETALADLDTLQVALEGAEQREAVLVAELQKTCVNESRLHCQYLLMLDKVEMARREDREKERKAREAAVEHRYHMMLTDAKRRLAVINDQGNEIDSLKAQLQSADHCRWHRDAAAKLKADLAESQRIAAEQAAQIATMQEEAAAAQKANSKSRREVVILAEAGAAQIKQIAEMKEEVKQLSADAAAAEQLNKQLMQQNAELQEALDWLRSAACAATEPGTPVQRISSTAGSSRMFSCSG